MEEVERISHIGFLRLPVAVPNRCNCCGTGNSEADLHVGIHLEPPFLVDRLDRNKGQILPTRSEDCLAPVPLPQVLASDLFAWKAKSADSSPEAFIFPNEEGGIP